MGATGKWPLVVLLPGALYPVAMGPELEDGHPQLYWAPWRVGAPGGRSWLPRKGYSWIPLAHSQAPASIFMEKFGWKLHFHG